MMARKSGMTLGYALLAAAAAAVAGCGSADASRNAEVSQASATESDLAAAVPASAVLERTFMTDGIVTAITQGNGSIYVGGTFSYVGQRSGPFAALSATAAQRDKTWPEFGGGAVDVIIPDAAGGFFIGGDFRKAGTQSVRGLVHLFANGSVDSQFKVSVNGAVLTLALDGTTLYVGGHFSTIGGAARDSVAAIDVPTRAPTAWNPELRGFPQENGTTQLPTVRSLSVADDAVYAVGDITTMHGVNLSVDEVAAVDKLGAAIWPAHAGPPDVDGGFGLTSVVSGNTLFVGGSSRSPAGLIAFDRHTGLATGWDPHLTAAPLAYVKVSALSLHGNRLYVGGEFTGAGGAARSGAAAYDLDTLLVTPFDPQVETVPGSSGETLSGVEAIHVQGDTAYLGGNFEKVSGVARRHLAAVDANTGARKSWRLDAPQNSSVRAIETSGSSVLVGGDFSSIGGVARRNLAALDATTRRVTSWAPQAASPCDGARECFERTPISALDFVGGRVYAGGFFTDINGVPQGGFAALDPTTGALLVSAPGLTGSVYSLTDDGSTLYAGGAFTIAGSAGSNVAAFEATTGTLLPWTVSVTVPPPVQFHQTLQGVFGLLAHAGKLYLAGAFEQVNGTARKTFAAVDQTTGALLPFTVNADTGLFDCDSVALCNLQWSLAIANTTLYTAGLFQINAKTVPKFVAALDATTGGVRAWHPLIASQSPFITPMVRTLLLDHGTIYLGGSFDSVNGQTRIDLAAFDASNALQPFSPGVNVNDVRLKSQSGVLPPLGVYALSTLDGHLSVAGDFTSIDSTDQEGFARFDMSTP